MNIDKEIKNIIFENGMTLTQLAKCIADKKGKNYSVQNLSSKLKKGTLNLNEFVIILEKLGYSLEFKINKN